MDSTGPIAARTAGQPSAASGTSLKPLFGMGFLTLVEDCFVGRRWLCDPRNGNRRTEGHRNDGRRRYREHHYRPADGHGRAS